MATGGGDPGGSAEDRRESLTCSLCLDIFTQPKILPCVHTFCLKCLGDLTARLTTPATFPCPQCRAQTTIPPTGVLGFQNNFYIRAEDLEVARQGTQCLTHPNHVLDFYCVDCQLPVCLKCVLTKHKPHDTQDMSEAARKARQQLKEDEDRLQEAVSLMTKAVDTEHAEQQALQDKKAAVKTAILDKHATVVAMADKYRDEQLESLEKVCTEVEKDVSKTLAARTKDLQELCQLQQRLREALTNDSACSQVTWAKEMRDGKGNAQAVKKMTQAKRSSIVRPVLNFTATLDTLKQKVQGFFGNVDTVKMTATPDEVEVEERFTCTTEKGTEVYSICPLDNGRVWVSYTSLGLQTGGFSDSFDEKGVHKSSSEKAFGKTSRKARGNGRSLILKPSNSGINTHSKSISLRNNHPKLCNRRKGTADIKREKVISEEPFKTESEKDFTINVGPHRAFDVDSSDKVFAVVEEAQEEGQQRKVKLYQHNKSDPVATYASPSVPFNPSDVCFFTLGSKEVLTIADEAGDSIHAVHVQGGAMTFLRHLAPGCPLLVQPTALNADLKGQLWVACRGGRVFTMSAKTP